MDYSHPGRWEMRVPNISVVDKLRSHTFERLTDDCRITKLLSLEGSSGGCLVQPPCLSMFSYNKLPRIISNCVLTVSKDEDPTTSLNNLCQCSSTLMVKKCFLIFKLNVLCFSLCLLSLVLHSAIYWIQITPGVASGWVEIGWTCIPALESFCKYFFKKLF